MEAARPYLCFSRLEVSTLSHCDNVVPFSLQRTFGHYSIRHCYRSMLMIYPISSGDILLELATLFYFIDGFAILILPLHIFRMDHRGVLVSRFRTVENIANGLRRRSSGGDRWNFLVSPPVFEISFGHMDPSNWPIKRPTFFTINPVFQLRSSQTADTIRGLVVPGMSKHCLKLTVEKTIEGTAFDYIHRVYAAALAQLGL